MLVKSGSCHGTGIGTLCSGSIAEREPSLLNLESAPGNSDREGCEKNHPVWAEYSSCKSCRLGVASCGFLAALLIMER